MKNRSILYNIFLLLFTFSIILCSCNHAKKSDKKNDEISKTPVRNEVNAEKMERGKRVYSTICVTCHMPDGKGVPYSFPPLAGSDDLMSDKERAIHQVIYGSNRELKVNGEVYNNLMPPQDLSNEDIAAVLTYVMNSWGNQGEEVTVEEVQKVRNKKPNQ
jgi:nitrite reductase (NO-forming)